jgi:hypothetical protein
MLCNAISIACGIDVHMMVLTLAVNELQMRFAVLLKITEVVSEAYPLLDFLWVVYIVDMPLPHCMIQRPRKFVDWNQQASSLLHRLIWVFEIHFQWSDFSRLGQVSFSVAPVSRSSCSMKSVCSTK